MSKVTVRGRLASASSPFPSLPPHLTRVLAGACHAFDLACIISISVGDSRCPSVSVSGYA